MLRLSWVDGVEVVGNFRMGFLGMDVLWLIGEREKECFAFGQLLLAMKLLG